MKIRLALLVSSLVIGSVVVSFATEVAVVVTQSTKHEYSNLLGVGDLGQVIKFSSKAFNGNKSFFISNNSSTSNRLVACGEIRDFIEKKREKGYHFIVNGKVPFLTEQCGMNTNFEN